MPRLYLATLPVEEPQVLLGVLPDLLKAADIAAVLLRLKPSDPRTLISRIKALAPLIQDHGAALLLDGHVDLVARAGADGAHLPGLESFAEALPTLKPDRIAGVGGLATRHDSMTAMVNWVEKGTAPISVIATGNAFPGRSRPLCPYPKHAHYKGQGDTQDANNFECR